MLKRMGMQIQMIPCIGLAACLVLSSLAGMDVASGLATRLHGKTWYVDCTNGAATNTGTSWTNAFTTIQQGIDTAKSNDTIFVADGVYDSIVCTNKPLRIKSIHGAGATMISGRGVNRCVLFGTIGCPSNDASLTGFTLCNGYVLQVRSLGGECLSSPAPLDAGAGVCYGIINNCIISNNTVTFRSQDLNGGAAGTYGAGAAYAILNNCLVIANRATTEDGFGWSRYYPCYGGGAYNCILRNCTIVGNFAGGKNGSQWYLGINGGASSCRIFNSMIYQNQAVTNDHWEIGLDDNVKNPQFALGGYRLMNDSPCLNVGSNEYVVGTYDLAGNQRVLFGRVDIGAYECTSELIAFNLGAHGVLKSGILTQEVSYAMAVSAPQIQVENEWRFIGWSRMDFTNVIEQAFTVTALYARVSLSEALDTDGADMSFIWSTGGATNWLSETYETSDGNDAAMVGGLAADTNAWVATTVYGTGTLTFKWKVSCDSADYLQFRVDGVLKKRITGEQPWVAVSLDLTGESAHTLEWRYVKGRDGTSGENRAWLDQVAWLSASSNLALADALDTTNLVWFTDGGSTWKVTALGMDDGSPCAVSCPLVDNQSTTIRTYVFGPGTVSFRWRVSCESEYDWLSFQTDGVEQDMLTGESGWQSGIYDVLGAGVHLLTWVYTKDSQNSSGQDCGWLDKVIWTPTEIADVTLVPTDEDGVIVISNSWLRDEGIASSAADLQTLFSTATNRYVNGRIGWESYILGLTPTNPLSAFTAGISVRDHIPAISWSPDLGNVRRYIVEGKTNLTDAAWITPTNRAHHFFRVKVEMP